MGGGLFLTGAGSVAYGLVMAQCRRHRPEALLRLEPRCRRYGDRGGKLLHGLAFTSLPIAWGLWVAFEGARIALH